MTDSRNIHCTFWPENRRCRRTWVLRWSALSLPWRSCLPGLIASEAALPKRSPLPERKHALLYKWFPPLFFFGLCARPSHLARCIFGGQFVSTYADRGCRRCDNCLMNSSNGQTERERIICLSTRGGEILWEMQRTSLQQRTWQLSFLRCGCTSWHNCWIVTQLLMRRETEGGRQRFAAPSVGGSETQAWKLKREHLGKDTRDQLCITNMTTTQIQRTHNWYVRILSDRLMKMRYFLFLPSLLFCWIIASFPISSALTALWALKKCHSIWCTEYYMRVMWCDGLFVSLPVLLFHVQQWQARWSHDKLQWQICK